MIPYTSVGADCVLAVAAGTVYNAERINSLLARHWRSFATQNYFDKHGVFFCALVSTPLLLDMFVILVGMQPCAALGSG